MEKIKLFLAEDFQGNLHYSTKSHEDIMNNTTYALMPGGFSFSMISKKQLEKLESDSSYYLVSTKSGLQVRG